MNILQIAPFLEQCILSENKALVLTTEAKPTTNTANSAFVYLSEKEEFVFACFSVKRANLREMCGVRLRGGKVFQLLAKPASSLLKAKEFYYGTCI
jgi:hypothetical protein